ESFSGHRTHNFLFEVRGDHSCSCVRFSVLQKRNVRKHSQFSHTVRLSEVFDIRMASEEFLAEVLPSRGCSSGDELDGGDIVLADHRLFSQEHQNGRNHQKHTGPICLNGREIRSARELLHYDSSRSRNQTPKEISESECMVEGKIEHQPFFLPFELLCIAQHRVDLSLPMINNLSHHCIESSMTHHHSLRCSCRPRGVR
ncbi:hypothetical protein PMAYCL1PPCAC_07292, partial [Pristionchus mayeri]